MERKRSVRRSFRRHYKKPLSERLKDYFRNFIAFMFSNVGIIGLVVGYTIAGAFIFIAIEGKASKERTSDVMRLRNQTANKLYNISLSLNMFDEPRWRLEVGSEMIDYQMQIVAAVKAGFDGSDNVESSKQWSFSGAFLYSLTVITTIGYGNVSPRTVWGKITTIVYAIIGMPLFLLYLSNIGDILARSFKWIYAKCCLCRWCPSVARRRAERRHRRRQQQLPLPPSEVQSTPADWQLRHGFGGLDVGDGDDVGAGAAAAPVALAGYEGATLRLHRMDVAADDEDSDDDDASTDITDLEDPQLVTVPLTICLAIMVGYVCGGAILFSKWEDWDFLDGSYFCFISLSTIGFGDIVPGDEIYNPRGIELSFIFCSMYLYLGMALIAMCFNLMQEEVIHKIRAFMKTFRHIMRCNR